MPRNPSRTTYRASRNSPYKRRDISSCDDLDGTLLQLPQVDQLDLLKGVNTKPHTTDNYESKLLVLRRGIPFTFLLKFDRPIASHESVELWLLTGRNPLPSKGTLLMFGFGSNNFCAFGWQLKCLTEDNKEFHLEFSSPPDALIGLYTMHIQLSNSGKTVTAKQKSKFVLIFNPWNKDDDVYIEGTDEKAEYVMNETGQIWVGSKEKNYGRHWVFGQFDESSLKTALYILQKSDLADTAFNNPVLISRVFSKLSNSSDDNGILQGNWSNDYKGGSNPTEWVSSVQILRKYIKTHKSVKYGQCWVFAAVLTSLFRSIGIPARCITNFESAHDNDGSMTIDRHWDVDDKPLAHLNDSVWNFHVWNEVWMKRQDLPEGHDGWQVIDGTPQESSDGVMQCGPASVRAVKEGEAYLPYDTKFVIAEVNGDIIEWKTQRTGQISPIYIEPGSIGFSISTKAMLSSKREDVTAYYKYSEGSKAEREVAARIVHYSSRKDQLIPLYKARRQDTVMFSLNGAIEKAGDLTVQLTIHNKDSTPVSIEVSLTCAASYYNGYVSDDLCSLSQLVTLTEAESGECSIKLPAEDYMNKLAGDGFVTVFCKAVVRETSQFYFKNEILMVDRPDLLLTADPSVVKDKPFRVEITFSNPLSVALSACGIRVEGPGITHVHSTKANLLTIGPAQTLKQSVTLKAKTVGKKEIVAILFSKQLSNITGSTVVHVI